jgi:predicted kinase
MKLITRVFNIPQESFFLFGPRGTGKSTWLKQNFPEAVWIDLLKPDILRTYSARPERLEEVVLGSKHLAGNLF